MYANESGNRTIALVDNNGDELESVTVNVLDGESVARAGFLRADRTDYGLRSTDDNPQLC